MRQLHFDNDLLSQPLGNINWSWCAKTLTVILSCWDAFYKSTVLWIHPSSLLWNCTETLLLQQTVAAGLAKKRSGNWGCNSWKRRNELVWSPGYQTTGLPSFELNLCIDLWKFMNRGPVNVKVLTAFPFSLSLYSSISLLLIGSAKISPETWAVVSSASNLPIPLDMQKSLMRYSTTAFCKCCTPPWCAKSMLCCDQRCPCPQSKFQHSYGSWLHSIPYIWVAKTLKMSPSKAKSLWKWNIFFSQGTGFDTLLK